MGHSKTFHGPKLSICIPTYNRASLLINCLNSIAMSQAGRDMDYEVCVSDNASTDWTGKVIRDAANSLNLKYFRHEKNLGRVRNYLKVVDMAEGEFIWLLGDDDLLLPHALQELLKLLNSTNDVDFFYINSYNLSTEFVLSFPQPFNTVNLPDKMSTFSTHSVDGRLDFLALIKPSVSSDFIGAMFLAVFRKENWMRNVTALDEQAVNDTLTFSHFDNTFPHVKIFARAFAQSRAYFCCRPLSVNLSGSREWAPMSPLINIVRLIESLDEYRKYGLPLMRYLSCKNFALRTFAPDYVRMFLNKKESGFVYIRPWRVLLSSILYPNAWLSPFYYIVEAFRARGNKNMSRSNFEG